MKFPHVGCKAYLIYENYYVRDRTERFVDVYILIA
jgi:hypothetical protein